MQAYKYVCAHTHAYTHAHTRTHTHTHIHACTTVHTTLFLSENVSFIIFLFQSPGGEMATNKTIETN